MNKLKTVMFAGMTLLPTLAFAQLDIFTKSVASGELKVEFRVSGPGLTRETQSDVSATPNHNPNSTVRGGEGWAENSPDVSVYMGMFNGLIWNERYDGPSATRSEKDGSGPPFDFTNTPGSSFNTPPAELFRTANPIEAVSNNNSVTVRWKDTFNPPWTEYRIIYDVDPTRDIVFNCPGTRGDSAEQSCTITNLAPGTTLTRIRVQALNFSRNVPSVVLPTSNDPIIGPNGLPFLITTPNTITTTDVGPKIGTISAVQTGPDTIKVSTRISGNSVGSPLRFHWTAACTPHPNFGLAACRPVSFSANDYNVAGPVPIDAEVTVTIRNAGYYRFALQVDDPANGSVQRATDQDLIIFGRLVSYDLTPGNTDAGVGQNLDFQTANALDNFGDAYGVVNAHWAIPANASAKFSDNSKEIVSAAKVTVIPTDQGTFVLTAEASGITRTAEIRVVGQAPTLSCNLLGKTETSASISYAAGDPDAGGSNSTLSYEWSVTLAPAGVNGSLVSFQNQTAQEVTVSNLQHAGSFKVQLKVYKTARPTLFNTCEVPFTIDSVSKTLGVCPEGVPQCPPSIQVKALASARVVATVLNQFGDPHSQSSSDIVWTLDGQSLSTRGPIASFPGSQSGSFRMTAIDQSVSPNLTGALTINVVDFNVSAAKAYPVPWKSTEDTSVTFTGLGTSSEIRIYTTVGRLVWEKQHTGTGDETWPVVNSDGQRVASGVYLYVVESPEGHKNGKLLIIQ